MRIALGADEATPVAREVAAALREAGHEVEIFGPLAGVDSEWVEASVAAARSVADGVSDLGVVLCWSGTGASIAANKVRGARAALCVDAPTARMAREYNHANILALSMRLTGGPMAREIVAAFLDEPDGGGEFNERNIARLAKVERAMPGDFPDIAWPAPDRSRPELWWEDLPLGLRYVTPGVEVSEEALVAFARRYDPQPFHTDADAATGTVFGELVASGWHTAAITMRLLVDHGPRIHGGLVGLGLEELRWKALRPGEVVHVETEVVGTRRSRTAGRGVVRMQLRTLSAGGDEVQHGIPTMLVPART